jgi:hypothetical protein
MVIEGKFSCKYVAFDYVQTFGVLYWEIQWLLM